MLAFFVFLIILTLVVRFVDDSRAHSEQRKLEILAETVQNNLVLAYGSGSSFETQLNIPDTLGGSNFSIKIDAGADVLMVSSIAGNVSVYKSIPDVSGTLEKGCNTIKKEEGVIQIDPWC